MTPQEKLDNFVKENKIELKNTFIPHSFSRNAPKVDITNWDKKGNTLFREKDLSLNWKIALRGNNHAFSTDYSKGIGHLGYQWLNSFHQIKSLRDAEKANSLIFDAVEKGVAYNVNTVTQFNSDFLRQKKEFPNPTVKEVLESLSLDASVVEYPTFESWAGDMGYDSNSRKDEKVYNACKEIAADFIKVVGGTAKLEQLKEILWELDNEPYQKKDSSNKP